MEKEQNRLLSCFQNYGSQICGRLCYVFIVWKKAQEEFDLREDVHNVSGRVNNLLYDLR